MTIEQLAGLIFRLVGVALALQGIVLGSLTALRLSSLRGALFEQTGGLIVQALWIPACLLAVAGLVVWQSGRLGRMISRGL